MQEGQKGDRLVAHDSGLLCLRLVVASRWCLVHLAGLRAAFQNGHSAEIAPQQEVVRDDHHGYLA